MGILDNNCMLNCKNDKGFGDQFHQYRRSLSIKLSFPERSNRKEKGRWLTCGLGEREERRRRNERRDRFCVWSGEINHPPIQVFLLHPQSLHLYFQLLWGALLSLSPYNSWIPLSLSPQTLWLCLLRVCEVGCLLSWGNQHRGYLISSPLLSQLNDHSFLHHPRNEWE